MCFHLTNENKTMKLVYKTEEHSIYSNKDFSGNSLDEVNYIVVPCNIEKQCYIKTSIGFQRVIIDISRIEALELIQGNCRGINLK